jgi:hypothetical protein
MYSRRFSRAHHRPVVRCFLLSRVQTHKEHILAKSGMYIGSCKVDSEEAYWVCNTSGTATPAAASKSKSKKSKKADSDEEDEDSAYGSDADEDMSEKKDANEPAPVRMEYRKVRITPGLYKLFDEILVNAADNKQRDTPKHIMNSQSQSAHACLSCTAFGSEKCVLTCCVLLVSGVLQSWR